MRGTTVKQIPFFNAGMLLGQSKVCSTECKGSKQKPVYLLHRDVILGSHNPVRADKRFCFYNQHKLKKASSHPDGYSLNYYIPPELGGLGMTLPNMSYISSSDVDRLGDGIEHLVPYTVVTNVQQVIAKDLYSRWTIPYLKPPMKPIGQEVDLDKEDNNFPDIRDPSYRILVPHKWCPMLPSCRPLDVIGHEPNWSAPAVDSQESERLSFQFKGVRLPRKMRKTPVKYWPLYKSDMTLKFQDLTFTEYKYVG